MTPYEAWQIYQKDNEAPQIFLDFCFYFVIGAALERRVYLTDCGPRTYPNTYIVLVGDAGMGKGMSITPAMEFFHYFKNPLRNEPEKMEVSFEVSKKLSEFILDPRYMAIPVGPDSITLPQLLELFQELLDPIFNSQGRCIEIHSSLCLAIEEMTTLIREEDSTCRDFFLSAYNCGNFSRELKCSKHVRIRNLCLNFLAGTTFQSLQEVLKKNLMDDGICSRTWFIVGEEKRQLQFESRESEEKVLAKQYLKDYLYKLVGLYGEIKLSPNAFSFAKDYYENKSQEERVNFNPLMSGYYSRYKLHLLKASIIQKFMDKPDLSDIEQVHVERGIEHMLKRLELKMDQAIKPAAKNPLEPVARKMNWLLDRKKGMMISELYSEFHSSVNQDQCREIILDMLKQAKWKVIQNGEGVKLVTGVTPGASVNAERLVADLNSGLWRKKL